MVNKVLFGTGAVLLSSSALAANYTLNFDSTSEQCCFSSESPPGTDYLSSHGLEFDTTLEVLDQSGNFGVSGYSAPNFLAWNTSNTGTDVDIGFTGIVSNFSTGHASIYGGTISIVGYDASGNYVDSDSMSMSTNLQTIDISGSGIVDINISVSGATYGVLDDFEWDMYNDFDGDGYASNEDCDDTDGSVYPGANELCDGVDNDCDGTIDEDSAVDALTWYADSDGDGYGNASSSDVACYAPTGYVADSTDCDDSDANTYPGATEYCDGHDDNCDGTVDEDSAADASTWYADSDGDSYGNASSISVSCYVSTGYVADNTDCDDSDATTYPGATEYCDGHDDNCDGTVDEDSAADASTWYADSDGDSYGNASSISVSCYVSTGYVADNTDCDDSDATAYPGATEYCDGHDDDCDGTVDEDDAVDAATWYADSDGDGYGNASSTSVSCYVSTGYVGDASDCDDSDGDTNPGASEYCDGHDDDCDGTVDEDDAVDAATWYADTDGDGEGDPGVTDLACDQPTGYVASDSDCDDSSAGLNTADADADGYTSCGSDCNDTDADINVDAEEIWYDGTDQNCDGWSDFDQDGDGFDHIDWQGTDCDDEDPDINVDAEEIWYDGIDQDCDNLSDFDADYDGQDSESYGGEDCDDSDPDTYEGAPDTPYDGIITDCSNANDYDADGDGVLAADYGGKDCDDANSEVYPGAEEIWYDGIDQDCDGNDDDQDGDGYPLDADCDDEDPDVFENCNADTGNAGSDTGDAGGDTGDGGNSSADKTGGCFSSTTGGNTKGTWVLAGALGLMLLRRKRTAKQS